METSLIAATVVVAVVKEAVEVAAIAELVITGLLVMDQRLYNLTQTVLLRPIFQSCQTQIENCH